MKITGYSTALFSTWYFCDEAGILFDCGDGVCSGLNQKSRKIKHVFVSHADRDHLAGLLQFNQLNARPRLRIYYPADCGSFPALAEFSAKFDPHATGTQWLPICDGDEIPVRGDLTVRAFSNRHIPAKAEESKSLSYAVETISRTLKPEFAGMEGAEIGELKRQLGRDAMTNETRRTELIYSGDTPIETDGRYDHCAMLIHEATFLTAAEIDPDNPKRNKHSALDQVIPMVAKSNVGQLVLGHFSCRYDAREIDAAIRSECRKHGLEIPVYRLLPGMTGRDILAGKKYRIV